MYSVQRPSSASSNATDASNFSQNAKSTPDCGFDGNLKLIASIDCGEEVMCCRFSPDGKYLAVGMKDGTIKIYSPETYACFYALQDDDIRKHPFPVTHIQFQKTQLDDKPENANTLIASYVSGFIKFWHFTSQNCLHTIQEDRQVLCVAFNRDGSQFITSGDGPQFPIYLYDGETKIRTKTLKASDSKDKMDGHKSRVFAAQFHPKSNKVFITGGWDDTVQFWSTEQSHSIRKIIGPHICSAESIDIDPVYDHIITGAWSRNSDKAALQIWDFNTGEKLKDVPPDPLFDCSYYCCQWLGKDKIICGGSANNTARIIDRGTLSTTGLLFHLNHSVFCIDNDHSTDEPPLIAIGSGYRMYLCRSIK